MVKLSLHHLSLTLLIGVLLYINSSDSAIDSCFIAKNVQTLSTCNTSCAWEDLDIWKLCPTNSFPDSLDSAYINATGGYTIELSASTYALGDLSLGSGSQVVKGPNTQVLNITGVGLTAKTIRVQNRGVLDLNLDKNSAAGINNVSTSLDITFNSGSTLNWRSGVIGINAATFTQLNAFTMNEGTFLNVLGSPTLARDLTCKGNITFTANSVTTITNKRTLTFDTPSYSLFNQETTIQNGESVGTAGLENLAIKGTAYFDLLGSSANFNILTQVSQPFIVNSGFVKFNKNTTLSGVVIRGGASVDINGLLTTATSITVAQDATFNWNNGDIKMNNGVFENQGTTTFQSSKPQPRLYSDYQTGTSIINRHNFVISTPITIKSTPILNYGVVSLPTTSDIGTFRMANGSIESSGSEMNSLNEFTCTGGTINSGVTINAKGTFSLKDTALVSSVVNVDSALTATVGGTIKMTSTPTLNITKKTTIDFQSATVSALNEDHGIIENYGILQGKVTLDGISLTNFGTIGAKFGPSNPITYIAVKNYGLVLDDSSSTVIDIFSELTKSEISVDGGKNQVNFQIGGSLTLRLRKTFTPDSTTTVTFMSWSPITTLVGNFSDIVVDQSDWPNTYGCNAVNVVKDIGKRNYKLTFGGCGTHPTSSGPIIRSVSKTTTILIVLVIVFLIGVCIFFIAWCKKKYKKKPWDRLKDDRF